MPTSQEQFAAAHPFLPTAWAPPPKVSDVNPADEAGARMRARPKAPFDELMGRVLELELLAKKPRGGGDTGGGGSTSISHPFKIKKVDGDTIFVLPGTMQDISPDGVATNIDLDVDSDATYAIYLDVEVDINGAVVAATLDASSSGKPDDADFHGYILIGSVVVASGAITIINQYATHSLRAAMCGRVVTDDTLTTRGTYEFWGF